MFYPECLFVFLFLLYIDILQSYVRNCIICNCFFFTLSFSLQVCGFFSQDDHSNPMFYLWKGDWQQVGSIFGPSPGGIY